MAEAIAALVGLGIGTIGTLIGAGGGFILAPLLLFAEPAWSTETVTAFSIAVVAANATAGAGSYLRMRRVDLRSFPAFALAAIPGAVAGALASSYIPRIVFDGLFGTALVAVGAWLLFRATPRASGHQQLHRTQRVLVDAAGVTHRWSFDFPTGLIASAFVGFLSSVFGIGGGIAHVPILVTLLSFPEHVATATSHAVLAVTALVATAVHLVRGDYRSDGPLVIAAALGAIAGAPIGARLSKRVPGAMILRILGASLASVGIRLIVQLR